MTSQQVQRVLTQTLGNDTPFRNDTYVATLTALHDLAVTATARYDQSAQCGLLVAHVYAGEAGTFRAVAQALQRAQDEVAHLLANGAPAEATDSVEAESA